MAAAPVPEILLVEDSPSDAFLIREAAREAGVDAHVRVARDGIEALAILRGEAGPAGARRPDLILLDLNLPRMDGRELLAVLKGDEALKPIPVIVLTSSGAEADVAQAYRLCANCYIVKPTDYASFRDIMVPLLLFWLGIARLPSTRPAGVT